MSYQKLMDDWKKEVEEITNKYSKEIKEYEKIATNENFEKIIEKIKKLGKYEMEFDEHPFFEYRMYGINTIENEYVRIYFSFFDFYDFDSKTNMEDYLKGQKYKLDCVFDEDFIEYETLKGGHESFCEIKKIIDEVIERNE